MPVCSWFGEHCINVRRKRQCKWRYGSAGGIDDWARANCTVVPRSVDELGEPSLRSFVSTLDSVGYAVYLLHGAGLVRVSGHWWDDAYELAIAPVPIDCWHDLLAVRRGLAQRELLRMFNSRHKRRSFSEAVGAACDCEWTN